MGQVGVAPGGVRVGTGNRRTSLRTSSVKRLLWIGIAVSAVTIASCSSSAVSAMASGGAGGGFDEGLVISRNSALGGSSWFTAGSILHFYDLTAVSGNFDGGSLVHLGYFRMWSHPRQ